MILFTWGRGLALSNSRSSIAPPRGIFALDQFIMSCLPDQLDGRELKLYRLLRESVHVPVGFAVALRSIDLVESLESSCDGSDAAYEQDARENHPDEVHEEVIPPEVQELRSRVCDLRIVVIEHAGSIVENQSINLAHTNDDLQRMAKRVRIRNEECYNEADWTPSESGYGLHAQHEWVRGEVPGV